MEPPYDLIVSTFRACFGSNGEVYPGSRDRAYYSGRAILWIHTLAVCRSGEFALAFPLPTVQYAAPVSDHDLSHLLGVSVDIPEGLRFTNLLCPGKGATLSPSHLRWISNILLHMSWATPVHSLELSQLHQRGYFLVNGGVPLDAMLNRLLVCCNLLGMPVEGEVLKIQDKSFVKHLPRIFLTLANTTIHQRPPGTDSCPSIQSNCLSLGHPLPPTRTHLGCAQRPNHVKKSTSAADRNGIRMVRCNMEESAELRELGKTPLAFFGSWVPSFGSAGVADLHRSYSH